MPRYYFHVVSPRNPVRDAHGVELAGLDAAHWHAMHLVYRLREHAPETGEDWVIEVSDELGTRPLVVLPRTVKNVARDEDAVREKKKKKKFVIPAHAGIQRAKRNKM